MIFRVVTMKDAETLFAWRNDPLTRSMSVNTGPVEWEGHLRWLERRLSYSDPGLYIAEIDGDPVGTIRIDVDEISYTVAPEHRGRGVATAMLSKAAKQFGKMRAKIKPDNTASIKAAEHAGHTVVLI